MCMRGIRGEFLVCWYIVINHSTVELNYVERGLIKIKHNQATIGELPCALMEFIPWTELSEDHKFEGDREVTTR